MHQLLKLFVSTSNHDGIWSDWDGKEPNDRSIDEEGDAQTPEAPVADDVSPVSFIVNTTLGKLDSFTESLYRSQTSSQLTSSVVSTTVSTLAASYALFLGRPPLTTGQFTRTGKNLQRGAVALLSATTATYVYEIARRRRACVGVEELAKKLAEEVVERYADEMRWPKH